MTQQLKLGRVPAGGALLRRISADRPARPVYVALVLLVVLGWLVFALDGGTFLGQENIVGIQQRSAALGIVAVGQTLVILAGSLDLSVAYLISLTSLVTAEIMAGADTGVPAAVAAALAVSALIGLANGLIVTRLRVHAFIATLGVALVVRGALDARYDGPAGSVPESFQHLGYDRIGPLPVSALLWAAVAVCAWLLLSRTRLGYRIYAVGGDAEVARLSGCAPSGPWSSPTCSARSAPGSPGCCSPPGSEPARRRSAPTAGTTWSRSRRWCSAGPRWPEAAAGWPGPSAESCSSPSSTASSTSLRSTPSPRTSYGA